ncbi:MAG: hypothetical protein KIT84_26605 [Labilithrix sp.]|nr:hypothetical protein [Labilithrix sp.]MCW5814625.1 hypothetical protein [Labilithrix sp.]
MRSFILLGALITAGSTAAIAGCAEPRDESTGTSEARATEAQLKLARDAKDVISGEHAHCNQCHTASRSDVKRWAEQMFNVAWECFNQPELEPAARVACMSDDKNDPTARYSSARLGLWTGGANFLEETFTNADPSGARFDAFRGVAMPVGSFVPQMTKEEFEKVVAWVFNGMPAFNEVFGGPPEPETCVTDVANPKLQAHLLEMKTAGWGARLADEATPMYGCGAATNPEDCLTSLPLAAETWKPAGLDQTMRVLRDFPKTSYWVRSSADGRYVGYGQFTAAAIVDLQAAKEAPPIKVDARYDPVFFPNNDGVSFAGTNLSSPQPGPIKVCRQSALATAAQQKEPLLTLNEPSCTSVADSVYQSIGASLDGQTFWMSTGAHVNDDGGNQVTAPLEGFEVESTTVLTPMVPDGIGFKPKKPVNLSTPLEGDQMFSPSSRLLFTRFGSKPATSGYTIRKITTKIDPATGDVGADAEVIGTICGGGTKVMTSFDERFVVTHRYSEPAPAANEGAKPVSSANVTMTDLLTGRVIQVTNMGPNQYALYPHFRADGWLYFLVRDMNGEGKETLVATDVALKSSTPGAPPPAPRSQP